MTTTEEQIKKFIETEEGHEAMRRAVELAMNAISCENAGHSDVLYCYSGVDIYWRCSKCGRIYKQEGGNMPMTI